MQQLSPIDIADPIERPAAIARETARKKAVAPRCWT